MAEAAIDRTSEPQPPIVFVTSDMGAGGAERVVAHLVNAFADRGRRVRLVLTFRGAVRGRATPVARVHRLHPDVEVTVLADRPGHRGSGPLAGLRRVLAIRSILLENPGTQVIGFLTDVNALVLLAALGTPVRPVVSERMAPGLLRQPWLAGPIRRLLYPRARCTVVQTERGRGWLSNTVPGLRIEVIPNPVIAAPGLAAPTIDPADVVAPGRRLLLCVGRLAEQKGHDRLIDAFASIAGKHPEWDLAILGEGAWRSRLEAQAASSGMRSRVQLPGVSGRLAPWFARADLFALPSLAEGFPNALAEAMVAGVAPVAYDCDTGPAELIDDGVNGRLVRPVGDVGALAVALDALMSDSSVRTRFATNAPDVAARYTLDSVLEQWTRLFD